MKRTAMPPRRTPLDRGTAELRRTGFRPAVSSGEAGTAGRRIRRRTAARAAEERLYSLYRAAFLFDNPACLICGQLATDVHHAAGRRGWRLLDIESFRALCRAHHAEVHDSPLWAEAHGLSSSRLANRETAQHE